MRKMAAASVTLILVLMMLLAGCGRGRSDDPPPPGCPKWGATSKYSFFGAAIPQFQHSQDVQGPGVVEGSEGAGTPDVGDPGTVILDI